jgi:hypothetical protein
MILVSNSSGRHEHHPTAQRRQVSMDNRPTPGRNIKADCPKDVGVGGSQDIQNGRRNICLGNYLRRPTAV